MINILDQLIQYKHLHHAGNGFLIIERNKCCFSKENLLEEDIRQVFEIRIMSIDRAYE